jgi:hypothetical protein
MAEGETALLAGNQDEIDHHGLHKSTRMQNRSRSENSEELHFVHSKGISSGIPAHQRKKRLRERVALEELTHKRRSRLTANFYGSTDLLDSPSIHNHDPVGHLKCFILIVSHKERGDS